MLKILVIDDSDIVLHWIRLNLEPLGFEVFTCNTPFGTQARVAQLQPDLILLDVDMPALDGQALCKMLKQNPRTRGVVVALHSSLGESELRNMALQCEADAVIPKTQDVNLLAARIELAVGIRLKAPG